MLARSLAAAALAALFTSLAVDARADVDASTPVQTEVSLGDTLTGEAKQSYEAARVLIGADDYVGAFERFKTAYQLSKDARLLWNMAVTQKSLHNYGKTSALVHRYLTDAEARLSPEERQEAEEVLRALELVCARLLVTSNAARARVSVDGFFVGPTPLRFPLLLDRGHHTVQIEKEGFRTYSTELDVQAQESFSASVDLLPVDAPWPACSQSSASWIPSGKLVVAARAGAKTIVDGEPLGTGHVECVLLAGDHQASVSTAGLTVYNRTVTIASGRVFAIEGRAMLSNVAESAAAGGPTVSSGNASWGDAKPPPGCGCHIEGIRKTVDLGSGASSLTLAAVALLVRRRSSRPRA
jgi:hypothetical protein